LTGAVGRQGIEAAVVGGGGNWTGSRGGCGQAGGWSLAAAVVALVGGCGDGLRWVAGAVVEAAVVGGRGGCGQWVDRDAVPIPSHQAPYALHINLPRLTAAETLSMSS